MKIFKKIVFSFLILTGLFLIPSKSSSQEEWKLEDSASEIISKKIEKLLNDIDPIQEMDLNEVWKEFLPLLQAPEIVRLKKASAYWIKKKNSPSDVSIAKQKLKNINKILFKKFSKEELFFKKSPSFCHLNLITKSYNDDDIVEYTFKEKLQSTYGFLMKNYKCFGKNAWIHLPLKNGLDVLDSDMKSTIEDLRLFEGDACPSYNLANALSKNCKTNIGKACLRVMMSNPTYNPNLLRKRQSIIKAFVDDPKLLQAAEKALETIKNYESDFFSFSDNDAGLNLNSGEYNEIFYTQIPLPLPPQLHFFMTRVLGKNIKPAFFRKIEAKLDKNALILSICPLKFGISKIVEILNTTNYFKRSFQELVPDTISAIRDFSDTKDIKPVAAELWKLSFKPYFEGLKDSGSIMKKMVQKDTYSNLFSLNTVKHPIQTGRSFYQAVDDFFKPVTAECKILNLYFLCRYFYSLKDDLRSTYYTARNIPMVFNNSYFRLIGVSKFFAAAKELESQCLDLLPAVALKNLKLFKHLAICSKPGYSTVHEFLQKKRDKAVIWKKKLIKKTSSELADLRSKTSLTSEESRTMLEMEKAIKSLTNEVKELQESLQDPSNSLKTIFENLSSETFTTQRPSMFKKLKDGLIYHIGKTAATFKLVTENFDQFRLMYQGIGELDVYVALARNICDSKKVKQKYCLVNFEDKELRSSPHLALKNVWNPLAYHVEKVPLPQSQDKTTSENNSKQSSPLKYTLSINEPVPSSIELGNTSETKLIENSCQHMLLTGPNASGKSTFMRSLMYSIWLAQTFGIAPASFVSMTPFHFIYSLKKDNENTAKGLSTHKAQLMLVKNLLEKLNKFQLEKKFCFVSCDEIFNGTNYKDATADTLAVADTISQNLKNTIAVIASHASGVQICESVTNNCFRCFNITQPPERRLQAGCAIVTSEKNSTNISLIQSCGYDENFVQKVKRFKTLVS